MATPFILEKDFNGNVTYGTNTSDKMFRTELSPNVAQSVNVPNDCTSALFSYSNAGDVWVDYEVPATLPTGAFSPTTSELNPIRKYYLKPGQTISFISDTNAYVHISFWR